MKIAPKARTRVKICGITRAEDALAAAEQGADAIGLVFYSRSPRAVDIEQAKLIVGALPPFVTVVGLFVDPAPAQVRTVLDEVSVDVLQFHGNEPAELCKGFGRPYIKAVPMRDDVDLFAVACDHVSAQALLLDTFMSGIPGGTGVSFDWSRIPPNLDKPLILAGGLTPENVANAIGLVNPYAVDVSGGVEAEKGIKDASRIAAFIREVKSGTES